MFALDRRRARNVRQDAVPGEEPVLPRRPFRPEELQLDLPARQASGFGGGIEFGIGRAAALRNQRQKGRIGHLRPQGAAIFDFADEAAVVEVVDVFHQLHEVAPPWHGDQAGAIIFGQRQQAEAHLGDDAEIALRKQARRIGAEAIGILLPGLGARHGAHAGAHHLAIGQHHFHPAVRAEMIAKVRHGVADAALQRIADRRAPARIGAIDHQLQAALLDCAVEVEIGHARLDKGKGALLVEFEHPVHALEIEHDRAVDVGRRAAVAEVLAGRDRKQGHAAAPRHAHHFADLRHIRRGDRGAGMAFLTRVPHRREAVAVGVHVLVARPDPVGADHAAQFAEEGGKVCCVHIGRQHAHTATLG